RAAVEMSEDDRVRLRRRTEIESGGEHVPIGKIIRAVGRTDRGAHGDPRGWGAEPKGSASQRVAGPVFESQRRMRAKESIHVHAAVTAGVEHNPIDPGH